jgi:hypothetical protein
VLRPERTGLAAISGAHLVLRWTFSRRFAKLHVSPDRAMFAIQRTTRSGLAMLKAALN